MFETTWKPDQDYAMNCVVLVYGKKYRCLATHRSNVFADELFGKKTAQKTVEKVWILED